MINLSRRQFLKSTTAIAVTTATGIALIEECKGVAWYATLDYAVVGGDHTRIIKWADHNDPNDFSPSAQS